MAVASIIVLVALFAATLLPRFDLGSAALAAAFLLGLAAGVPTDEVTGFFPADFFVLIVGVTALFAVAHLNGTLDWLLDLLLRLVGGRAVLVPLVPFVIGAVLTAVGTLPAAATAIVAPIALGLAARYRYSPLVAAVLGVTGIISGLLSPLAVYGVSARGQGDKLGLGLPSSAPVSFLLGGLLTGVVVCVVCLVIGVGTGAVPRGRVTTPAAGRGLSDVDSETPAAGMGARALTLACMLAVVVLSVGFDMNVGYLGLTAAVLLQLVLKLAPGAVVSKIPWGVVLLIGGLLTYVGLMQHLGAFEKISDLLRIEGSPSLSLLVLCYIAGVTSFAASSIAVFVTTMPLLPTLVADGVSPVGAVLALALASILVDINPLGITGGLILGAAEPSARPRLFRQLLTYGLISIVVAPPIAWLAFGWW
ncbi:SLC13 family permease [Actinophytocola algeriensis]|uniref:Di/tricarboxylate transporter n=1 Tax=Actinophytocola algeriensis TaxID=1768010 RepID=A0A7W7Q7F5_9PSEU|nr:SLC13 family permease [Actinophytocola algeriensis]MBB4908481.1 di/tricarboxylate transporter [Actinophytocola algeriensis]MBE1475132.1 di/tricarboxylate transporter [Actinophytocola algeriensis]